MPIYEEPGERSPRMVDRARPRRLLDRRSAQPILFQQGKARKPVHDSYLRRPPPTGVRNKRYVRPGCPMVGEPERRVIPLAGHETRGGRGAYHSLKRKHRGGIRSVIHTSHAKESKMGHRGWRIQGTWVIVA